MRGIGLRLFGLYAPPAFPILFGANKNKGMTKYGRSWLDSGQTKTNTPYLVSVSPVCKNFMVVVGLKIQESSRSWIISTV